MDVSVDSVIKLSPEFTDSLSLLENIPDAILVADSGGLIVYSNPLLDKVFGYESKELLGKPVESLIPERNQALHIKHRQHFSSSPKAQAMSFNDLSGLHKSGEELRIEVNLSPYPLGDAIFSMAVIRDVSERYWEQLHLKEREERLRVLLESTRAIPWAADPVSWCFTYVGPQAIDLLGYPIEKWYEKDFWVSRIHPDDRETVIQVCADCSKTRSNYDFEYRMLKSDGDVVWFRDIVNVEHKNGAPYVLRGFLIDITAHKETKQKLGEEKQFSDNIIKSLPGLFFMVDRQGRYVRWNKNTERLIGCSGDELLGRVATDFASPETRDHVKQEVERCFREGSITIEYENLTADGQKVSYVGYAVRTRIGGDDYLVGIEIDISKQKQMERDNSLLRDELNHVSRVSAVGELTASVAHELNQPLAAIMSNAQAAINFLDKKVPDMDEVRDALMDIVSDDQRAGNVINRLRKLLIKAEPEKSILDLTDLVDEVILLVKNDALHKNVLITHEQAKAALPLVAGDRIQLQQVMLNIILNAFDAMLKNNKEERSLVISTIQTSPESITTAFTDNGAGIEQQDIDHLFDAFYTSKQTGMGMGLTISRSIVEAHGGKLWATQNESGQGVTFYFSLPLDKQNKQ